MVAKSKTKQIKSIKDWIKKTEESIYIMKNDIKYLNNSITQNKKILKKLQQTK